MRRSTGAGATNGHDRANGAAPYRLIDMHCHLDRMANAERVAADAATRGIALFDATVTPTDTRTAGARFADTPNVRVGVGLHPWWLANGSCDDVSAGRAAILAARSRFVGEVGLDFSERYRASFTVQQEALELIVRACAEHPRRGRVVSLHAVRSAGTVLDILERYGLTRQATCVFHWFSGTSDEFARARKAGCWFSVNERMLASKKGREYARQAPIERLLLETDAPPELDAPYSAGEIEGSLNRTLDQLAELREDNCAKLAKRITAASSQLLEL